MYVKRCGVVGGNQETRRRERGVNGSKEVIVVKRDTTWGIDAIAIAIEELLAC